MCLERVSKPMAEKRPKLYIIEGRVIIQHINVCKMNSSPMPLFTCARVVVLKVTLTTVGTRNCFVDGDLYHTEDSIVLLNGDVLHKVCNPISWSANIPLQQKLENNIGAGVQLEVLRQIMEELVKVDIKMLKPNGEAADIFWWGRDPEKLGLSEYILDIIEPPMITPYSKVTM